ncbi:MAG: hypothetical protein H8E53_00340 [Planctomycetes bacterium]|nr:hypothetical protein [Planctomycetota bacterium]
MTIEDPDELDKVDHDIRVNELRAKAQELTGDKIEAFENPDAPPEVIEQFWENVVAFEKAEWTTDREELEADGVYLLPPDEVKDELLPELLLKLCQHLAEGGTFVFHTEHLSDRELYEYFWREGLNEPRKKMRSPERGRGVHGRVLSGSGRQRVRRGHDPMAQVLRHGPAACRGTRVLPRLDPDPRGPAIPAGSSASPSARRARWDEVVLSGRRRRLKEKGIPSSFLK